MISGQHKEKHGRTYMKMPFDLVSVPTKAKQVHGDLFTYTPASELVVGMRIQTPLGIRQAIAIEEVPYGSYLLVKVTCKGNAFLLAPDSMVLVLRSAFNW